MNAVTGVETDTTTIRTTVMRTTVAGAARQDAIRMGGVDGAMTGMIPVGAPADMTEMIPADALGDMAIETTLTPGQTSIIRDGGETGADQQIEGIVVEEELRLVPIPLGNLD